LKCIVRPVGVFAGRYDGSKVCQQEDVFVNHQEVGDKEAKEIIY